MSFISVGMQSLWEGMKTLPAVGKMLRVMELLFKITAKLTGIERTLIDLQKKCTGSLLAAIVAALLAVAAAITAVAAAIADRALNKNRASDICNFCYSCCISSN